MIKRACSTSLQGSLAAVMAVLFVATGVTIGAERKTESWDNNQDGFAKLAERIESRNGRNLLARNGVRIYGDTPSPKELVDGSAGVAGAEGRVQIDGQPSVIAIYLGQLKPVYEIGLFTYNGDTRANQDFEVRVADNSAHPGQLPKFPDAPLLTTGDTILGRDGGGFHTSFVSGDNKPLVAGKVDWIEFRIWRTYPVKAGLPARNKDAGGWNAVIELEAFGEPGDVIVMSPEEKARAAALREKGAHPPYEKKATWQETMLASREAILRWECEIDQLVLSRAGVGLGNWHTLGALAADGEDLRQIEQLTKVDLAAPVALKTRQLAWREAPEIKDGQLANLAAMFKARSGEVVVLCRTCSLESEFGGHEGLTMGLGLAGGKLRVLGGHSSLSVPDKAGPALPNEHAWAVREAPGRYHVLALLPVSKGGECNLWFSPQVPMSRPGAGPRQERIGRRQQLYDKLKPDFKDEVSLAQIKWEQTDSIWVRFQRRDMAGREYFPTDWVPGQPRILVDQYNAAAEIRAAKVDHELATIEAAIRERVAPWMAKFTGAIAPTSLEQAQQRYYAIATVQAALAEHHKIASLRLAVKDQQETFGERYAQAGDYAKRSDALETQMNAVWPKILAGDGGALSALLALRETIAAEGQAILLANPLLVGLDKLLLGRGGPGFASNWGGPNHIGSELVVLSPVKPDGQITSVYKGGRISDMDLSFDAKKILFSENERIHEVNVDGSGHRQITAHADPHTRHYDACRMPSGQIMFVSTACEQAVPCTGEWYVGNMHLINDDGTGERRLCFDQDHDWNPCVLENGQIVYTRWEYTDTPHYFTRLLFTMNPDGTNQTALYGSNSYWPNAKYWPRPIPGKSTQLVCIASGHHGVSRVGQMLVLDIARGRQEADGVVHRIGDRGKRVEAVIEDGLVMEWWPRFAWPYPLAEPETNRGSGKYFLVNCQLDQFSPWGIYLVDIYDNMTPLLMGNYAEPIPLRPRLVPPTIPPRVDQQRKDALVYMANVYEGGGLRGYPPGSVKALRLGSHEYRFGGNGDTYAATYEGGWDVKRILGTVPVNQDGSAYFRVPANTPIFVQPLDAEGKSLQVMRSWFSAMPGEMLSCVGCHESQNQAPSTGLPISKSKGPAEIAPWYGPARGFSFDREVQPVLDHRCVGCHDGQNKDGQQKPDFRAKHLHLEYKGSYSPSYLALAPYVRRAGYEADYHMAEPAEFHASTSALIQLLEKGHHNVTLSAEECDRIYTWIDFNVPYAGNWRESQRPPQDEQVTRRAKYLALHAGVEDRTEAPLAAPAAISFEPPAPEASRPAPVKLDGWPLSAEQAADLQKRIGLPELNLDLGDGGTLALAPVPAGRFVMGDVNGSPDEFPEAPVTIAAPFYVGRLEVTNRQFAQFNPAHDSRYIDARGKDRFTRGYPVNQPDQPVVRVTWYEAMAFCQWLSKRTGYEVSLPTEAQWEWACRAGSATPWAFGDSWRGIRDVANVADATLGGWGWGRVNGDYSDGALFSIPGGRYKPNAWGLCDTHGNVAEWTRTEYRVYPYVEEDGRNVVRADADGRKSSAGIVVRGGSWNDTFRSCRSASRWHYLPCQPVYNVGFRIVCKPARSGLAAQ